MGIRFRLGAGLLLVVSLLTASVIASAQDDPPPYDIHEYDFHSPEFHNVWERTDRPVQEGETSRTWLWGPKANTPLIDEPYDEAEDGVRQVQYGDKSRMEMPVPGSNAAADSDDSPWRITQGLLAYELMTGNLQIGDELFETEHDPSNHPAAGDPDGTTSPTYATMGMLMDADPRSEGNVITQFVHRHGHLEDLEHLAEYDVTDEYFIEQTGYYIADVFWDFMTSSGPIYEDGILQQGQVFESPFYAVGFPLTPAVWSWTKVDGEKQNVLVQCFERRCLTYTPDNDPDWQVETGNVGQHYFHWRYQEIDQLPEDDDNGAPPVDDGDNGEDDGDPPAPAVPESFTVTPDSGTSLVGSEHEITVTVTGDDEQPFQGANVSASVTDGPNSGTNLTGASTMTDTDGQVTLSYTGTETGTDTITVSVQGIDDTETVTRTWVDYAIAFNPDGAENPVGSEFTLTATLNDSDGAVELDEDDDFSVSVSRTVGDDSDDLDDEDFDVEVNTDGEIEISYTGPENPAVDTIDVTIILDVDGQDEEITGSTTKTWVPGLPDSLTLTIEPDEDVTVDDSVTLTANVVDEFGNPVPNVDVLFESDAHDPLGTVATDAEGNAVIDNHSHDVPGDELITATEQANDAANRQSDSGTIPWAAGAPASLTLDLWTEEESEVNAIGDRHHVVATVQDANNNPIPGVSVTFSVEGENNPVDELDVYGTFDPDHDSPEDTIEEETTGETNSVGRIGFLYAGEDLGKDTITATVTISDGDDLTDSSNKRWCDAVVRTDGDIQDAVTGAEPGALICVEPGEYEGQVRIETNGLTLLALSDDPEETTIRAVADDQGGVVAIVANDITVEGFTLDNDDENNGRAVRVSQNTDGVTIHNNVFVNAFRGVQGDWAAAPGQTGPITNLRITGNVFNTSLGVSSTEDMDGLVITGNTFNTTVEGIGLGEGLEDGWGIDHNTFAGQEDHVRDWRNPPQTGQLQLIIDANEFAAGTDNVEIVDGNAIRDVGP